MSTLACPRQAHRRGNTRMKYMPKLDPKRDLAGATPETLARALFRPLRPRPGGKPVVGDEVAVEEVATDEASDSVPHLGKRT